MSPCAFRIRVLRISKKSEKKRIYCSPSILRLNSSLQMCCIPAVCCKFELLDLTFVVASCFHSLSQTLKLNFLRKSELVVTTILHRTSVQFIGTTPPPPHTHTLFSDCKRACKCRIVTLNLNKSPNSKSD